MNTAGMALSITFIVCVFVLFICVVNAVLGGFRSSKLNGKENTRPIKWGAITSFAPPATASGTLKKIESSAL
jgi:hypothetical protein